MKTFKKFFYLPNHGSMRRNFEVLSDAQGVIFYQKSPKYRISDSAYCIAYWRINARNSAQRPTLMTVEYRRKRNRRRVIRNLAVVCVIVWFLALATVAPTSHKGGRLSYPRAISPSSLAQIHAPSVWWYDLCLGRCG